MRWIKILFSKNPKPTQEYEIIRGPVVWLKCGVRLYGEPSSLCERPECKICHPMSRERAAVINERYLRERKCKNQTCCGSCPGGCTIGSKP